MRVEITLLYYYYAVQFDVNGAITTSGGGLDGTYDFVQLHFHWGANDTRGSEHTVEGMSYPLEVNKRASI